MVSRQRLWCLSTFPFTAPGTPLPQERHPLNVTITCCYKTLQNVV